MRWQLGGNLEPVQIICETDWRQCPRAILKYIWTEVVTDVVDCLITEETVWRIIAILIACMMLLRLLYAKRKCTSKPISSDDTLNRVGCKVEDLELKINILTYKLQYGTWPLPHQIRNPGLRKQLRNLRLTLSTSSDRNAWIKRMLLSSTPDTRCSSRPKLDSTSVQRMTEVFDTKTGYVSSEIHRDVTSTDYSDVKSSKTTSVESLEKNNTRNGNQRGLSQSENLGKLRRTSTQLSLLQQKDSSEWFKGKKAQKQKRSKFSTSQSRLEPCDEYAESLRECKRFLRELKESNKGLELDYSSSSALSNDNFFMKETYTDEKVISTRYIVPEMVRSIELKFSLNEQNRIISGDVTFCLLKSSLHAQTTDARNASRRYEHVGGVEKMPEKMEREEKNFKRITNRKMIHDVPNDVPQVYRITNNDSVPLLNSIGHEISNFPTESSTRIVISPGDNVIQMSRETLYQIKQKLESLDNVLRAYGMLNSQIRNIEEAKENGNDIRAIYRNVIDTLDNMKVEIESINETRRNEMSFDFNATKFSNKVVQTVNSDCEPSKSGDKGSLVLMEKDYLASVAKRNRRVVEESKEVDKTLTQPRCNHDLILDHEPVQNNSKEQNSSSSSQISRTYVKTLSDSSTREIIPSRKNTEELSQLPVSMETDEDQSITSTTSSQPEISKGSDFESKSTALLLREALECKKELLSRVKLQKFYSNIELGQNNENYRNNFKNDNVVSSNANKIFPSKLLDIITEERSISGCTDKTSGTYIFLRMKQPSETSDRSLSSLNMDSKNSKQEDPKEKLSKHTIPVVSSRYFSLNDFTIDNIDRSDALRDFQGLRNIILEEIPNDKVALLDENETDANSLRGKKRQKEVEIRDDNDDVDDNRKRLCHRVNVKNSSTSYARLRRAKSVQESCRMKRNNLKRFSGSVSKISNVNELLRENITDSIELFSELRNSTVIKDKQVFVKTDDLSWNRTFESSSSGSIKHPFAIDNGSMTNFLSSTDSNIEMIKYPVIARNDNDETLCNHDLSLRRRPGTFSFAHLKMNTVISKDGELYIRDPYFLAETKLSEVTCGETIEVNVIPLSVPTAMIDSHESGLFTVACNKVLKDIADGASTLKICYNDDLENEMQAMQSVENIDCTTNVRNHENDEDKANVSVEEISENQIEERMEQLECVEIQPASLKLPNNHTDIINVDSIDKEDSMKSRSNNISQQSSSYFTGDTSSSMNELDIESFKKSCSNIEGDPDVRDIDIRTAILEPCINSCLDLLNDRRKDNINDTPLQQTNKTPIVCIDNDNDASNETSASYLDANISQMFDDDMDKYDVSIVKELEKRDEGLFFDGSLRYKKPSVSRSTIQNVKEKPQIRKANSIKSKPAKVDIKSKSTISVDRSTYSKKNAASDSQLKAKSNFSIIGNNSKNLATDFTGSCTRPSSCNLSRERSRSYVSSCKSESSSRSASISQSEDQLKEEETFQEKLKLGTHSKQSLSSPKSFSKSCIPILKSRLDARRGEQTTRPKSPMRGPLTMTGLCRNKIDSDVQNITEVAMPTEGNILRKERSEQHLRNGKTRQEANEEEKSSDAHFITESSKENTNVIGKNCGSVVSREQTVIYVNIVQQHDRNVTRILDPEKFLEYTKGESIEQKESSTKLQPSMLPKIVTIVSSVSNESDINAKDNSSANLRISTGTLKSLWSVTIQQKETEVTAKPSVTDTSTSISDLQQTTEPLEEHQIFGIPTELTNEEYSYMLKILTQKGNLTHLKEIQNLCNRLRPRNESSG